MINKGIRAREVRVVDPNGTQIGIMPLEQALSLAGELELDLVEVSPKSVPPVCRIMDYGKYKYELSKKSQEAKKKQVQIQVKEIKFRPKTEEHDLQVKVRHIKKFLEKKNKVKVSLWFRGREIARPELGEQLMARIASELEDMGTVEQPPRREGRHISMMIGPKH
jgi:translation initiation factor IF-3